MTRRQSNNQWIGGIAAHPPQKIPSSKIRWKFLVSIIWDQEVILLIDYLQKGQTTNAEYYSSPMVKLKDILKGKRRGKFTKGGCCSCTTMPRLTVHFQPRRNWPTWTSSVLITHPILRIWPRWTTTCSLDWKKKQLKVRHFCPTLSLLPQRPDWTDNLLNFFLSGSQKLEQRPKKCIELRGKYAE